MSQNNSMESEQLLQQVTARAQEWLGEGYDQETRAAVQAMLDNEDKTELIESFYRDLEFGTGGLRGIMGAGTNRMNIYTVGSATQGLANYLKKNFADMPLISVAIGHDCRNNSRKFAEISADIFSANGIKVYLFESLRPTPEVSFAIRELGCQAGINLTASHNPKEYNGYKAYWSDGAQVIAPHDTGIIDEVNKIASVTDIKFERNAELIEIIGEEMDKIYLDRIKTLSLSPDIITKHHDIPIVYTPIHGTGVKLIPASLANFGFTNIIHVPEQDVVSGDFPTVVSPNPEEPAALDMAVKRAIETNAELVMASDPDADRIGIAVKNDKGEWVLVNGNQIVMLMLDYIMTTYKERGLIKGNEFIVKTIVTTETIKTIAERNNIKMYDCYTGFKWIAAIIRDLEGKERYIGGGEESYGFLAQDFVRDNDAVSAMSLMAEMAAWAKDRGMTMYQMIQDIYIKYGFSKEKGISVVRKGKQGAEEIQALMKAYRENPVKSLAGSPVTLVKDFQTLTATDANGNVTKLDMPCTSNVLQYFTAAGDKVSVRPSGTEPKIKFYIEVRGIPMATYADDDNANRLADEKIEAMKKDLCI